MGEEMLKEVLKAIADGNSTIADISKITQLEEAYVINAIDELRKIGYLSSGRICTMDRPACRNCPLPAILPSLGLNLCITEKGIRYLEHKI